MEIYLPIAGMSVHWLLLLGLGGRNRVSLGTPGVGGGFLHTASDLQRHPLADRCRDDREPYHRIVDVRRAHTMAKTRDRSEDGRDDDRRRHRRHRFRRVAVGILRRSGQMDVVVSASYVVLLGTIGSLMLRESWSSLRASQGVTIPASKRVEHVWLHGWPLKARFPASRLYISVIPPIAIGFVVGMLSAILGVGGGFIVVPAMIYLLRMPTNVVIGTSLLQIIVVAAATTILQAVNNHAVDAMLAVFLIAGGVESVRNSASACRRGSAASSFACCWR
ncbi:MAG: sulfite exporter TauE/SafE family protein [Rhizomicrobium sp.]